MQTILVVDDDRNLRRLYKAELESEGYRVLVAQNGIIALELLEQERPDLIVMDIRMPVMDGLEAMTRVLKQQKSLPVILNTAYSSYLDNFSTWAAEGYVVKSSDLTPLKEKIRETFLRFSAASNPGASGGSGRSRSPV
jgi:CheY-like chemotaxis protein